jgi:hypothetical protein
MRRLYPRETHLLHVASLLGHLAGLHRTVFRFHVRASTLHALQLIGRGILTFPVRIRVEAQYNPPN